MTTRGPRRDVFIVLAPLVALVLLGLWVASSGVVFVIGEPYRNLDNQPEPTAGATPPPPTPNAAPTRDLPEPWWFSIGAWASAVVALISIGYLIYRLGQWLANRRMPVVLEPLPRPSVARTVLDDADEQFAALAEGPSANAIIACWQRLEAAIATAGSPALAWETPAEVTRAVLSEFAADEAALTELLGLYHEARFSAHELGEDERARAIAALERIHAGLKRHAAAADPQFASASAAASNQGGEAEDSANGAAR
ncbi:MAG: DUF4129 domain-containing protein [Tetrasphaera sp.]